MMNWLTPITPPTRRKARFTITGNLHDDICRTSDAIVFIGGIFNVERVVAMVFKACGLKPHTVWQGIASRAAWKLLKVRHKRAVKEAFTLAALAASKNSAAALHQIMKLPSNFMRLTSA